MSSKGLLDKPTNAGLPSESIAESLAAIEAAASHLPPNPHAIDAAICVAADVMTDRSARHGTRPEHDASPRNAPDRIFNVLAIHDRLGRPWIESETSKPQQGASSNPGKCR